MKLTAPFLLLCTIASLAACAKLKVTPTTPTPTPSPTQSGSCTQVASNTTVVIAMASTIAAANSTYGPINGYAAVVSPQTQFFIPTTAAPVTASTTDILQFVNVEPVGSTANRSAAALMSGTQPATSFPAPPYTFPQSQQSQLGTQIGSAAWSTGRIAPNAGAGYCASQQFRLSAGTWYFGDLDSYNLDNRRGVIIVH